MGGTTRCAVRDVNDGCFPVKGFCQKMVCPPKKVGNQKDDSLSYII